MRNVEGKKRIDRKVEGTLVEMKRTGRGGRKGKGMMKIKCIIDTQEDAKRNSLFCIINML